MRGTESDALFHVVDWLPTFLDIAGGETTRDSSEIDGVSQLQVINGEKNAISQITIANVEPIIYNKNAPINAGKAYIIALHIPVLST